MIRTVIENVQVRLTCLEDGTLQSAAIEYRGAELANIDDVVDDSGVVADYIARSLLRMLPGDTVAPA
ncbi:hypothetical protein [Amycolatopsis sp. NPDC004079]|uniref:hypothetical protein n=1 Tax=Amycolatopsis sp. NPDC004079 TaxID=3154549 RepID=UPI0033B7A960